MLDYVQGVRETALKSASKYPDVADRARTMNMIEAIIEGEMTPEQIVQAIEDDTLPVRYVPIVDSTAPPAV